MNKQAKEEFVVITDPFNGSLISYILHDGTLAFFGGLTYEEYVKNSRVPVKLVTWFEYEIIRINYFCKTIVECSEESFKLAAKLAKTKDHIIRSRYRIFYAETISEFINTLYVHDRHTNKYYKGIKKITLTDIQIYQEIIKDLNAL